MTKYAYTISELFNWSWIIKGSLLLTLLMKLNIGIGYAKDLVLESVDFSSLPGGNLQLQLTLNGPASAPRIFHTENPARIALDLPGVSNGLSKKSIPVNVNGTESVQAVESAGRTRVVINMTTMAPYSSRVEDNRIFLEVQNGIRPIIQASKEAPVSKVSVAERTATASRRIENVDFRRGEKGEGRVLVTMSDPKSVVDIRQEGQKVVVKFPETELPPALARKLDVTDFATPVKSVESNMEGNNAQMTLIPLSDEYDYSSYQTDKTLVVEFRPLTKVEKEDLKKKNFVYSGEKLTLNFQDIPVRSVLQILADFTNLNVVASDTVQGNVTLRLEDVPWDQALDLVLKSKSLGKRQEGNIIRVAPLDEINKLEKDELEAQKAVENLEPLRTEIIQVNYTTADEIKKVLLGTVKRTNIATGQGQGTNIGGGTTNTSVSTLDVSESILSTRGNVTSDPRTNQLIIKDTARNLERVREVIRQLDRPIRQVLIESRIVIANNDFTRELGSRLSLNRGARQKTFSQTINGQTTDFQETFSGDTAKSFDALVDLASSAASGSGGAFGLTLLKAGDYLLDLELSAAQIEGRGEIISTPRLITADHTKATIKQGVEIPYQVLTASGGGAIANIQFKEAVLELNVTPNIAPNDNVLMQLLIKKDAQGQTTTAGPAIDKREIETTAQVGNGETVVLGGVFEGTRTNNTNKIPFFGDLPGIGFMFRRNRVDDTKRELLIFITPKILKQTLSTR
jgi:type IV pilus assembly protein PilQ